MKGELPSYKIYEDEFFFGFLNIHPHVKGHTLVIPRKHYQWVYEVPEFGTYWDVALKVTKAIQKSLKPEWVNYFTYGAVPHAHIHILPRFQRMNTESHSAVVPPEIQMEKEEFETIATLIKQNV